MAAVVEVADFRKGRRTRRGESVPAEYEGVATVVARSEIDQFLGVTAPAERAAHLRRLRDEGLLIHNRGRLTQVVRGAVTGGERVTAYVFKGHADAVLRIEPRPAKGRGRIGRIWAL